MRAARVSAALLAAGSWLVVLRGLWFAPISPDPVVDLEAGGGFAANVEVYLPALGITLAFLAMVIAGVVTRALSVSALVVSLTAATFSAWILTRGYLLDFRPSLDTHLWVSIVMAVIAAWVVVLAASAGDSGESAVDVEPAGEGTP